MNLLTDDRQLDIKPFKGQQDLVLFDGIHEGDYRCRRRRSVHFTSSIPGENLRGSAFRSGQRRTRD